MLVLHAHSKLTVHTASQSPDLTDEHHQNVSPNLIPVILGWCQTAKVSVHHYIKLTEQGVLRLYQNWIQLII